MTFTKLEGSIWASIYNQNDCYQIEVHVGCCEAIDDPFPYETILIPTARDN